jgi:hypothetical protein
MSVTIQVDLPEPLIKEARALGLLENRRMAELLATEIQRRRAGRELKGTLDEVRSVPGDPMSLEEINAEVKAARSARQGW